MADDTALNKSVWSDVKLKQAQMLQCCVCQSQVTDSAWVLTCLHVCCNRCASLSSATPRDAESDGVDNSGNEQPIAQIKKNDRSIACARCQETAQVVISVTGPFLDVVKVAHRSAAASCNSEQNHLQPDGPSFDVLQLVSELQQQQQQRSSQLFCLTCDAPCDEPEVDREDTCLQLEHDVRALRDPRVTKRLDRLLDDARRARQRLLDERTGLTTASDAAAQLDVRLHSMESKCLDELLKAERHLTDIIKQSCARAIQELRSCSGAYKVEAERALSDTGRVREHADYVLRFSEIILASAGASPSTLSSMPELLRCFQQQLRPLADKCRAAHDGLAAATVNPESAVYLERQEPPNMDTLIARFIGHPKLSVGQASPSSRRHKSCRGLPAITYSRDVLLSIRSDVIKAQYRPAAIIKDVERTLAQSDLHAFSYSASISSNQNEKQDVVSHADSLSADDFRSKNEATKAIADLPASSSSFTSANHLHLVEATASSLDGLSQSSSEAADHERESNSGNFSYSAANQSKRFEAVSGSEILQSMPIRSGRQQTFAQVNSSQSLAKFQLSYKCWDIAIAEDRNSIYAAAYHGGMREFSFDGRELSSWQTEPPPGSFGRQMETGPIPAIRGRSDTVYTVDTLNDGRVIVGLLSSSSVAVLRRALSGQVSAASDIGAAGATGDGWLEDGERVPLGSRPWRLASDGVDLVAVTHASHGVKAQPGTSFDLVSLSERAVVQYYRFPFMISSVAIADGESIFVASFPTVDVALATDERRMQFTIVQLDMAGNWLWKQSFDDNLFDICCRPAMPMLYLALGRCRRVIAVNRRDGSEVAELLSYWHDAPVRLSLRRNSRQNLFFTILRYDLRSVEVYSY